MSNNWKTTLEGLPKIVKYLLVVGVVVIISNLFPNNAKFKYQYKEGDNWKYDELVAPFDFAINKSQSEINTEVTLLKSDFSPYYEIDQNQVKQVKKQFAFDFSKQLEQDGEQFHDVVRQPQRYLSYGNQFLDNVYSRGIIQLDPSHSNKGKDFVINILKGNTTHKQTLENLLTVPRVKELLSDSLPYSRLAEPDFLYPVLEELIVPNLILNDTLTEKFWEDQVSRISPTRDIVERGNVIVPKGGIVTKEVYEKLESFRQQYEMEVSTKKSYLGITFGYLLLTSLIVGVFFFYILLFSPEIFAKFSKMIFILLWLVLYSYLVFAVENIDGLSAYMIPFCIVPIVIKSFYNENLALFTHITVVLIASFLSSLGYEFTFLQILAGIVVILSRVDTNDWSRFFYSMLLIFITYSLAFLGLSLIQTGDFMAVDWTVYTWIFLNVVFTMLAYPLIPLLERFFGFTSSISLVELSDMNRPLLQELTMKAPGTLQHSLQVANLSEAAARKIGADPLLVKVAALYHDIGKTLNPSYFIENQSGVNPHNDISDLESAKLIIGHVEEGVNMAKKYRLPNVLIDFIKTHHGTTRVEYFYRNYVKDHPDKEFDETLFRYAGPKPVTKEESILMLADSIEAACKSMKNPTEEELMLFIDKIINEKVTHGQLEDSEISFSELEDCKEVFKQFMKSIHHVRIEYPEATETKGIEGPKEIIDQGKKLKK